MLFADLALSRTLERAEGRANVDFVETRARLEPAGGAAWIEVGGTYAMFDSVGSPLTQTFGLGLFEPTLPEHLDRMETFFEERGADVFHEVSPLTDPALMGLLCARGYQPIESSNVLGRERKALDRTTATSAGLTTRVISRQEVDLWAKLSSEGWAAEHEGLADFMLRFATISARCNGAFPFVAELDGEAISTAMLFVDGEVALLAGASTRPSSRNRGAQNALLAARLLVAEERGCRLAVMSASPGSPSQKNAQRNGFSVLYTRTKWQRFG